MYLGSEQCISYSFSQIINLLNGNTDENKRTNMVIHLGHKFIRLFKTIKFDTNTKLENIYPLADLRKLANKMDDSGLFWLGDTLLHLITDNCDIIVEEVIRHNIKDSYVILRLNYNFVSYLTIGSLSLLQLPMLTPFPLGYGPRPVDSKGLYYPYIKPDSTNLHLFEGDLIKSKYNQRDKTTGSDILYRSIDYLNSMKFKINKTMLKYVLNA
nr:hypothetical protein [Grifola frondosa]